MTSSRLFVAFTVLFCGLLLGSSTAWAQNNEIDIRNLAPDSRLALMIEGLRQALQDFAGEGQFAELVNQDGELLVLVRDADGAFVAAYHAGLAGNLVSMDIQAVDGNGEVISANPYISSDAEK